MKNTAELRTAISVHNIPLKENRGEKPAIGQFLQGSLTRLTNDRDTKREKMTAVCFGLL